MKNKKLLASAVFFGTLGIVGVAGIATFAHLLRKKSDSIVSGTPGVDFTEPVPFLGGSKPISQDQLLSYKHLGLLTGSVTSTTNDATLRLRQLLPYVGKELVVSLYDVEGKKLLNTASLVPNGYTQATTFSVLDEATTYKLSVTFLDNEVYSTSVTTKSQPKVVFTTPGDQYPQGRIQLSNLQSYAGQSNENKLYLSFKKSTDKAYGENLTPVTVSTVNSFDFPVTNLVPNTTYTFKLVQVQNGVVSDVLTYPESFVVPKATKPTMVTKATHNSVKISLYGFVDQASKTIKARYRINTNEAENSLKFKEVDVKIDADGNSSLELNGLGENLTYEFQIGEYEAVTVPKAAVTSANLQAEGDLPPAENKVFTALTLLGDSNFKTFMAPKLNTTVESLNNVKVSMVNFLQYSGKSFKLEYKNLDNLSQTKNKDVLVSSAEVSLELDDLAPNSRYSLNLVDESGNVVLTSSFKTSSKVLPTFESVAVKQTTAALKFKGGLAYKNQDLIFGYKKAGVADADTDADVKIVNVKGDAFELALEGLEKETAYVFEIMDSGRNTLLSTQTFTTSKYPTEEVRVTGNWVVVSVDQQLKLLVKNGFVQVKYWTTDEANATVVTKNFDTDMLLGNSKLEFELENLLENTTYNYQVYSYAGPLKEVYSTSTFATKSKSSNTLSVSAVNEYRGTASFANLTEYAGRDLKLELSDGKGNVRNYKVLSTDYAKPVILDNLYSDSEYTVKLYAPLDPTTENSPKNVATPILLGSEKFKTTKLLPGAVHAPVVKSGLDLQIDMSATVSATKPFTPSKQAYRISVHELESYIGKTLEFKYWSEDQTEAEATKLEKTVTTENTNWNKPINFFTSAPLKYGMRYSFKVSVKDAPTELIWEVADVLIEEADLPTKALNLEFTNVTSKGFRAKFSGYQGAEGQEVTIAPRFLKSLADSEVLKPFEQASLATNKNFNGSQTKLSATVDEDGSFYVDIEYSPLVWWLPKESLVSITEFKNLQFYVYLKSTPTKFFNSPREVVAPLKDLGPAEFLPTARKSWTPATSLKIWAYSVGYVGTMKTKIVDVSSPLANEHVSNWNDGPEIEWKGQGSQDILIANQEVNKTYNVAFFTSNGQYLGIIFGVSTAKGLAAKLYPSTTGLKADFTNSTLGAKSVQFVVSKNADFSNPLKSTAFTLTTPNTVNKELFVANALEANTVYYYKLVENDKDEVLENITGKFQTFSNFQLSMSKVGSTSATLKVSNLDFINNPLVLETKLVVEYSTSAEFTSPTEVVVSVLGNQDWSEVLVSGLTKNTKYYFRLKNKVETSNKTHYLNSEIEKAKLELKTLEKEATTFSYLTKAKVSIESTDTNLVIRYGVGSDLSSMLSAKAVADGKVSFDLSSLAPGTTYNYEILDNAGVKVASSSFTTKKELTVGSGSNGSTSQIISLSDVSSFVGQTLKLQYRKKATPEVAWTDLDVVIPLGQKDFQVELSSLTAETQYEYKVTYQPGAAADALVLQEATSFTTSAVYKPTEKEAKVSSTVTTMSNFSLTEYTPVASLAQLYASSTTWKEQVKASLKYINLTSQKVENGKTFLTEWFALNQPEGTTEGNLSFKVQGSGTDESLDAYVFFQNSKDKLNVLQLNFKLVNNQVQVKLVKAKWAAITTATKVQELVKKSDFAFDTDISGGDLKLSSSLIQGLTNMGYLKYEATKQNTFVAVSALKFVAQKVKDLATDENSFVSQYTLNSMTFAKDESTERKNYASMHIDDSEYDATGKEIREGTFSIGNANFMLGNTLANASESLFSLGVNSLEKLDDLIMNNDSFGFSIKSDLSSDLLWLFRKDLKVTKEYFINSSNEELTLYKFIWQNGNYFEGISLYLGVNNQGVVTLSRSGYPLRMQLQNGQSLENVSWNDLVANGYKVANANQKTQPGIGIMNLTLGSWTTKADPGLFDLNRTDHSSTKSSLIKFS